MAYLSFSFFIVLLNIVLYCIVPEIRSGKLTKSDSCQQTCSDRKHVVNFYTVICLIFRLMALIAAVTDDVVVAVSNSGLVKVWTIHDANDTRLVRTKPVIPCHNFSLT